MNQGPPIALVGLGLLGSAVAERLLASGRAVVAYDLAPGAPDAFLRAGGRRAESLGVLRDQPRVCLCLPDAAAVRSVVAALEPRPGTTIVDLTTGPPDAAAALAAGLAGAGVTHLDAPVSGSSDQVRRGEALLFVGGPAHAFEAHRAWIEAIGGRAIHAGEHGAGLRLKLVTNLVLGLNRAALAEGLVFARALGLDLPLALSALAGGAAYSRVMDTKGRKMVERDFAPQARLRQHLRDVGLIREEAAAAGLSLPLSDVHLALLARAMERGAGDLDNSAILQAFE